MKIVKLIVFAVFSLAGFAVGAQVHIQSVGIFGKRPSDFGFPDLLVSFWLCFWPRWLRKLRMFRTNLLPVLRRAGRSRGGGLS